MNGREVESIQELLELCSKRRIRRLTGLLINPALDVSEATMQCEMGEVF